MPVRPSVTTDKYQESHLNAPYQGTPSKGVYGFLALFCGVMAVLVYLNADVYDGKGLIGQVAYWFFQLLPAGIGLMLVASLFWSPDKHTGQRASHSWWPFLLRDGIFTLIFTPMILVGILGIVTTQTGPGVSGPFVEYGGWPALFGADTPLVDRLLLIGMGLGIAVGLGMLAMIPVWLSRSTLQNLGVIIKRGRTRAIFSEASYAPGAPLGVRLLTDRPGAPTDQRRVFLNYLTAKAGDYPPSSKNYQRTYLHTEYQDVTVAELEEAVFFQLPALVDGAPPLSDHDGSFEVRFWEVLLEEPGARHWARFFVRVG